MKEKQKQEVSLKNKDNMGPVVPITADLSLGLMVGAPAALSASEGVPAGLPAHLQSREEH